MKTKNLISIILTAAFFAVMIFLTLFAQIIHNSLLPRVTASKADSKMFTYSYIAEDGAETSLTVEKTAVSEEMLQSGVYVVYSAEKNGTKRNYVRLAEIETGVYSDGYYEVISGLLSSDKIVTAHTGEIFDGCEVITEK